MSSCEPQQERERGTPRPSNSERKSGYDQEEDQGTQRGSKAVEKGEIAPGRVWRGTKRPDGTYERIQEDPEEYRRARAAENQEERFALKVRRKLGVSQDRFAKLLGISAATVRNWEQGRRQPTGAAKVLLRVAVKNPEAVLAAAG